MKKTKPFESSELLKAAFLQLKQSDGFSVRKWSKIVGIDASVLNLIVNSKRLAPKKHLRKLADSLDFDPLSWEKLSKAHMRDHLRSKGHDPATPLRREEFEDPELEDVLENEAVLLKSWLHLSVLEASTLANFNEDPGHLAGRFGVPVSQVRGALKDLESAGFLVRREGRLVKKNRKIRIPARRSREIIRNFHLQMLDRAKEHLRARHDQASFESRLMTGFTVAVEPQRLEQAILLLEKSLFEACSLLSEGESTEVYQLQLQLFPLMNPTDEKTKLKPKKEVSK